MKILVYGTESFDDYNTFIRGLVVAIDEHADPNDKKIEVFTAGPHKINNFTAEFINKTEGYFKQQGIKARFSRVRKSDILSSFDSLGINHVVSFNSKSDNKLFDVLLDKAEKNNIKSSYYKY